MIQLSDKAMVVIILQYRSVSDQQLYTIKDPDAGKDWRQKEKGAAEDEMIG